MRLISTFGLGGLTDKYDTLRKLGTALAMDEAA